ncbi:MAG: beta-lactamase family protein [Acidimicrobiaceae bacterium]|nr:beta-lactamase family protein [Acidimicrobiaceae bacterium]MDA9241355.1 beta-lactamase family protein [bacterium]MDC1390096.1 beta-lactamase family protein [Acidimicrobiales bacterium]
MTPEPADLSVLTSTWPGSSVLAIADETSAIGSTGDLDWVTRIASISKLFTSYACLVALEEGTISLDDPAGPHGSTVRHLMAHASGLGFETDASSTFSPGTRRIYSNVGMEQLAAHLEAAAGMSFTDYLVEAVIEPLGLIGFEASGSPAHGMRASVNHLLVFGRELLRPTLIAPETLAQATSPVFPELRGALPGFGSADPNLWGLGFEIRGNKKPHWTGILHDPTTFGHFGGSGSFLWVDPSRRLIGASVSTEVFGQWAVDGWAPVNTVLIERYG